MMMTGPTGVPNARIEDDLAQLPRDASPGSTIARSRALRALGRQPEAVSQLEQSLEAARSALDWRGMSALWRELGDVQIELGRAQDALDTYAKRLTNAKSLDVTRERAFAQVDMAYAFVQLSQWTPAQHALEDAEVLAKSDLFGDGASLEKMAYVREKLLAREVAVDLFDRARAVYAQQGDATGEARAAVSRAYLTALEHESSKFLDASLDPLVSRSRDPEVYARLLRYRGETAYLFDHQYPHCLELAQQGMPIAERRNHHALAKTMGILMSVCAGKMGSIDLALDAAHKAVRFSEDEWQSTSVPSARQASGFEALLLYRHILALDVKLPDGNRRVAAAFEAMEHARARTALDAAVRGGAGLRASSVEVPPLLAKDKQEIEDHVAELDKEIIAGKDDAGAIERRRDALWALDDVKAAIAYRNPLITRMRTPQPATLERARELLDDHGMLLAFLMTNDQAVAIAITKQTARLYTIEGGPAALTAAVNDMREKTLTSPDAPMDAVRAKSSELYAKLVGPVKDLIDTHDRLIVLPHGPLAMLPFEALVDGNGRFVVETHDVTYSQSATIALEDLHAKPPSEDRRAFVGLGDPVYDWSSYKAGKPEGSPAESRGLARYLDVDKKVAVAKSRGRTRAGLVRLPGTAREVQSIASMFGSDAKLYLRDQASEENVKSGILAKTRIVHFASHGLFDTDYQALALTMRPDAKDDGFLLGSEVAELKLDADLVVMSACDTGRAHEVLAEPVSGLALALRTAGARRVVASLWSVDDEATAELMKTMYQPLVAAKGGVKPHAYGEALTEAKRKLVATTKWQHPFFWAPFVLVGS